MAANRGSAKRMTQQSDEKNVEKEGKGIVRPCPFCGLENAKCQHFLGTHDSRVCQGFSVVDVGQLPQLNELFVQLEERVKVLLNRIALGEEGNKEVEATVEPWSLKLLVHAYDQGKVGLGFAWYLAEVCGSAKVPFRCTGRDGLGEAEIMVDDYWAKDAAPVLAGVRRQIEQDIARLIMCRELDEKRRAMNLLSETLKIMNP